jgi:hypothetical protein
LVPHSIDRRLLDHLVIATRRRAVVEGFLTTPEGKDGRMSAVEAIALGLLPAGVIDTAVMTVVQYIEMSVTQRAPRWLV